MSATHLLIAAGAGLSADSGLPVYDEIANEVSAKGPCKLYRPVNHGLTRASALLPFQPAWHQRGLTYADLCHPSMLELEPEVAYVSPQLPSRLAACAFASPFRDCTRGTGMYGNAFARAVMSYARLYSVRIRHFLRYVVCHASSDLLSSHGMLGLCLSCGLKVGYGFWGSCFNLYRETVPHRGYSILKEWCRRKKRCVFVEKGVFGTG